MSTKWVDFYVKHIYIGWQKLKLYCQDRLSINLGEIIYILLGIYVLYWLIKVIKFIFRSISLRRFVREDFLSMLRLTINSLCILFLAFHFNWTILYSYNRQYQNPLTKFWLPQDLTFEDNKILFHAILTQLELLDNKNDTLALPQINTLVRAAYQSHIGDQALTLKTQASIFRSFLAMMGISGYYHPLTGESFINAEIHPRLQPFVTAHEMSHQLGVTSESEANYIAYYISVNSQETELQYSAYLHVLLQCLAVVKYQDSIQYKALFADMPTTLQEEVKSIYAYRERSKSELSQYTMGFYNWFLKNNDGTGLRAYGRLRKDIYNYEILGQIREPQIPLYPSNPQ